MTKKHLFSLLLVFLILIGGGTGIGYAYGSYQKQSIQLDDKTTFTGGVIRIDRNKGVYLHTNKTHHSRGIKSVAIDKRTGGIKVVRDRVDAIISVSADPDETLAHKNIDIGISGGGTSTYVLFYQDGKRLDLNKKTDYNKVASSTSNFWISWISEPQ